MTSFDSISPHIVGWAKIVIDEFGPAIACMDARDDVSTIYPAVDRVISQCGSAELDGLE